VSPVFPKIVLHLRAPYLGAAFTITTTENPAATPYIQHVVLNGREHTRNWIAFHDITAGGTMQVDLGSTPNRHWGAAAEDAPPSLSDTPATQVSMKLIREQSRGQQRKDLRNETPHLR
jgi:putative alpha-1,2-mannosidase